LKSAFKAFTFNKVSDFFMFIFLVSTYSVFYTFDITSLNNQAFKYESLNIYILNTPISYLEFISIMLLGAAFIKSAQLGGHVWLPDSMEAPVPASSLIHSATLVSAGIYLILRFNFIFDYTQFSKFIIPIMGSLTAAYGGVCAIAQSDIKKTLAYSTISHCGFLMVLCSTEMNEFTILYLYVHGFFKAGVFMCVGNVLRITRGYQDTRRMGGLLKYLPFEYFCALIGLFNLAGLPFTFGFFIKHLLLISLDNHIYIYYFVIFNSLVGAFAGLFYSYKLMTYTFNDFKKGNKVLYLNLNRCNYNSKFYTNSSLASTLSIFFLFIFSYIITYYLVKYLLYSNFLFSDFMNTTLLTNYYSILSSYNGYLLNFSYINLTAIVIIISLCFSKYRGITKLYLLYNLLIYLCLFFIFIYLFFMFI
jgi:NADH-ubiquinone oxidoreductase chain 5